ncbi:hypothetical protein [Rubritalea marina]|uniref:hypothetical protein n=1 Tax=Rubritalea marina TaxID=361055 RepID=UPI00036DEC26|nr:hypothetical protein [Rubritalea marina]
MPIKFKQFSMRFKPLTLGLSLFLSPVLLGAPGSVTVVYEHNTPGHAGWMFQRVKGPSSNDYADRSMGHATVSIPTTNLVQGAKALALKDKVQVLFDGLVPTSDGLDKKTGVQDYERAIYFDNQPNDGRPNRVLISLDSVQPLFKINTYTWHDNIRANQFFKVYYSDAPVAPASGDAVASDAELLANGWSLLTTVQTQAPSPESPQVVSSVRSTSPAPMCRAKHILIDIFHPFGEKVPFGTLFGEIDIHTTRSGE